MVRTLAASLVVLITLVPSVRAEERATTDPVAPSAAVAAAWKKEAPRTSATLRSLIASYAAVQGLDMTTTIVARNRGAVEANPFMQGGYATGIATKAALGAATMIAVRSMGKRHHKAAVVAMIAANAATAAVARHNLHVAQRLGRH